MDYVYPAIFYSNDDGSYTITYPDLPGCITEGKTLAKAMQAAQSALVQWIIYLKDKHQTIPNASDINSIATEDNEFVNFISVNIKDGRAVKRTVSIPKWMDEKVSETGLSLSRVLQEALVQKLM